MSVYATIRTALRPVKRIVNHGRTHFSELLYRFVGPKRGTKNWLIRSEVAYGGLVTDVPRRRVSPLDRRSPSELAFGGMTGGDRMLHHGYAKIYAHYLKPFLEIEDLTIAEFGVLTGTGLAIWCDLFPTACVVGLDIDLTHFDANRSFLLRRGAFAHNSPKVHEYDQLVDGSDRLAGILSGRSLDIVVDDGLHSLEAIVRTWRSVRPYLSQRFVYFVEDYGDFLNECRAEFSGFDCRSFGLMTVVSAGQPNVESSPLYG